MMMMVVMMVVVMVMIVIVLMVMVMMVVMMMVMGCLAARQIVLGLRLKTEQHGSGNIAIVGVKKFHTGPCMGSDQAFNLDHPICVHQIRL